MNAVDFLQTLYGSVTDGWLEVTYLAPPGVKLYPPTVIQWRQLPLGEIDPALPTVHKMNDRGYGVYFGVAVRKERKYPEQRVNKATGEIYTMQYPRGKREDALYLTAFYADIDHGANDENLQKVNQLKPSIVVKSGGGYHGYLLLDKPLLITDLNRADITRTLKGIAKFVESDPHVAELARVFRLPDTVNTKPERQRARCEVVDANSVRYAYEDVFMTYAPLITPPQRVDRHIPIEATGGLPEWVQRYLNTGAPTGQRNDTLYKVARAYNGCGLSVNQCMQEAGARAEADGLTREDVLKTIDSAYNTAATVMIDPKLKARMAGNDALIRNRREIDF